jgi:hypothetical protein
MGKIKEVNGNKYSREDFGNYAFRVKVDFSHSFKKAQY